MKKTYIAPECWGIEADLTCMIAASISINNDAIDQVTGDTKAESDWEIWSNNEE